MLLDDLADNLNVQVSDLKFLDFEKLYSSMKKLDIEIYSSQERIEALQYLKPNVHLRDEHLAILQYFIIR